MFWYFLLFIQKWPFCMLFLILTNMFWYFLLFLHNVHFACCFSFLWNFFGHFLLFYFLNIKSCRFFFCDERIAVDSSRHEKSWSSRDRSSQPIFVDSWKSTHKSRLEKFNIGIPSRHEKFNPKTQHRKST